jgi:hypothetical protein
MRTFCQTFHGQGFRPWYQAPPVFVSMNFIAGGLRPLLSGVSSAVVILGFGRWQPLVQVAGWGQPIGC